MLRRTIDHPVLNVMKTSSVRYKGQHILEAKKRDIDWKFVMAFLLGTVFGEISADPLSDLLFFMRESNGVPMTPVEQVFYWYYLPAIMYLLLFVGALLIMFFTKVQARYYVYVIMLFAGISLVGSLYTLGFNVIITLLLVVPLVSLFFMTFYEIVIHHKKKTIIV